MNYTKQVAKGTAALFVSSVLTALLGYFFRVYLARTFSPYEYGLFFSVFALVTTIVPFKDFGLAVTIMRYIPEFIVKKQHSKIKDSLFFLFVFQTVIYGIGLIVVVLLSKYLATNFFHDDSARLLLIVLAIAFMFSTFHSIFNSTNIGFEQIGTYAFFQVAFSAVVIIALHLLNVPSLNIANAAWAYLISYFLTSFAQIFIFVKTVPNFFRKPKLNKNLIKELFGFSKFYFFASTAKNFFFNNGTHILTYLSGMESVAYFNVAMPTANFIRFIFKPFSIMMLRVSSEVNTINKKLIQKPLNAVFRYFFVMFFPVVIFTYFVSDRVIVLLYGEKYAAAAFSFVVLVAGNMIVSMIDVNSNIMLGMKKPKESMIVSLIMLFVNAVLCFILIPRLSYLGASIAFTIASMIGLIYSLFAIEIISSFISGILDYIKITLGGMLLFFFMKRLMIPSLNYFQIAGLIVFSGIVYLGYIFALRIVTMKEIEDNLRKIF
ncbi:MAG: flippase [archaeon]